MRPIAKPLSKSPRHTQNAPKAGAKVFSFENMLRLHRMRANGELHPERQGGRRGEVAPGFAGSRDHLRLAKQGGGKRPVCHPARSCRAVRPPNCSWSIGSEFKVFSDEKVDWAET